MTQETYVNRSQELAESSPATSAEKRIASSLAIELTDSQRQLLDALVASESVPIDELRGQVESVRELIHLGCAILEVKAYPWGVEFEVRPTLAATKILESLSRRNEDGIAQFTDQPDSGL